MKKLRLVKKSKKKLSEKEWIAGMIAEANKEVKGIFQRSLQQEIDGRRDKK